MALGYRSPIAFEPYDSDEIQPVPGNVHNEPISENLGIDHGGYLPSPFEDTSKEQKPAASFVDALTGGKAQPNCS